MSSEQQKIYKGTYGKFLADINAPPLPYEDSVRAVLAANNNKVSMKKLIDAVDAPVTDLISTIHEMKKKKLLRISRQGNDEIVEIP